MGHILLLAKGQQYIVAGHILTLAKGQQPHEAHVHRPELAYIEAVTIAVARERVPMLREFGNQLSSPVLRYLRPTSEKAAARAVA